jgi:TRAP-type C4-dicarboxylate transport system permease small subunit
MARGLTLGSRKPSKVRKKMPRRLSKALSLFLGVLMFTFGFLKFFQPFRGWFDIQIQQSHLPHEAILAGKLGEMVTGCLFLLPWLRRSLNAKSRDQLLLIACLILVTQMSVAIYVHLQPQVPASVLPLGFKPPVIPGFVLLLALLTAFAVWKERRAEQAGDMPTR